jgi:antitoxin (DNA-binding transcriptional repressor) of toxin-antitoxin stability system
MIDSMSTVHMSENEVTANFADVLEKVRHGVEVIVERNHQPVAVIRSPKRSGRAHLRMHRVGES